MKHTQPNPFVQHDKENRQANGRSRIMEADFSKISQEYVLDGGRLRAKSIKYRDERKEKERMRAQEMVSMDDPHPIQVEKLLCLQQNGVLNKQEKERLVQLRKLGLAGQPLEQNNESFGEYQGDLYGGDHDRYDSYQLPQYRNNTFNYY